MVESLKFMATQVNLIFPMFAAVNSLISQTVCLDLLTSLIHQARIYEGSEPIQFFSVMQSFIVFKVCFCRRFLLVLMCCSHLCIASGTLNEYSQGGLSDGYKNHIEENQLPDETYKEDGVALFRVQGSGPDNMQAIQVDPVM